MDHVASRRLGYLAPTDTLEDLLVVLRAGREWSLEVDEAMRQRGLAADGGILGIPVGQLDAMIVVLERAQGAMRDVDVALAAAERAVASARRAYQVARICVVVCSVLSLVNLAYVIAEWF